MRSIVALHRQGQMDRQTDEMERERERDFESHFNY